MIDLVGLGNITNEEISSHLYYSQEVPFAIFIFLYSLATLLLYLMVLMALRNDSEFKDLMAYQIMFHIGIADCIQLTIHFIAGIYVLDGSERYSILERIIGAIMNGSWVTMLILSILLTVNRFFSIVLHFESKQIFSKFMTRIYLAVCWLIFFLVFSLNISPLSRFYYVVPTYTFHYEADHPLSGILRTISANISLVSVCVAVLSYASIFLYIYFKAAILSKRELYLTIQVLLTASFHVLSFLIWEYLTLPDHPIATFFGHFVWMAWNSIPGMLHVIVSPRIRQNLYEVIGMKTARKDSTLNSKKVGSVMTV